MKRTYFYKVWLIGILILLSMTGCSKSKNQEEVIIVDGQIKSYVNVEKNCTVADALAQAEISINEKDVVEPELTETISDFPTEIIIKRHAQVTVKEGTEELSVEKLGGTVADALEELDITIGKHDYVNHSLDAWLTDQMNISVTHRKYITLNVDGNSMKYMTEAETVKDFLKENGITLGKKDRIKPKKTAKLVDEQTIRVYRVDTKEEIVREEIAFGTIKEYSSKMYQGEQKIKRDGTVGEKEVTYQVVYVDGKEESRTPIKETVIKEPVDRIIVNGTKEKRQIVSKKKVPSCDGSNHGYYVITWSDGVVEYEMY